MSHPIEIKLGQRFGQLTIIKEVRHVGKRRAFKMRCDCGTVCVKKLIQMTTGKTRSCGCLKVNLSENSRVRTHGRSADPIYFVWRGMLDRCGNQNNKAYADYGGRGIKVCQRWHKFENFLADMGERPSDKHELDRVEHDGNYEPINVRWLEKKFQARNRRKQKNTSSRFRGVDRWKGQFWRARITVNRKVHDLGVFNDEEQAAKAYDAAACQHSGYPLNFSTGVEQ